MKEVLFRSAEDCNLQLVLSATERENNVLDRLIEEITVPVQSASVQVEGELFVEGEFYTWPNIAQTCHDFFEKYRNYAVTCQLRFDNSQSYYNFRYCCYVRNLWQFTQGNYNMLRIQAYYDYTVLVHNGKRMDSLVPPPPETTQGLQHDAVKEIVAQCMQWQAEHPPKKLSPIEQMRMKANSRFGGGIVTATPPAEMQAKPVTNQEGSKVFNPDNLKVTQGSKNYQKDLDAIVGLDEVKDEFNRMIAAYNFQKERAARLGLPVSATNMHMCFMGPPGTGKTTIARVVAGFLHQNGIIRRNECIEISGLDLLANYAGQTSEKTRIILERAKGCVLFIDEAYAIAEDTMGREAINVLLKEIEDNRGELVVIFAGYERDMQGFLDMNEGFKSRINRYFHFNNYSPEALANILVRMLQQRSLVIREDALNAVVTKLSQVCTGENFSNGRYVRNLVEHIEDKHIYHMRNNLDSATLNVVTIEDVVEVCK